MRTPGKCVRWLIPWTLLALHVALLLNSAYSESVTVDEPLHLLAGYSSLALHDFGFSQQHHHPALGTMLNAVPLLFVRDLKVPPTARQGGNPQPWKTQFLYGQRVPADQLLLYCRMPTMLLSAALAIILFFFALRLYGFAAANLALAVHVLSPNILAHGRLITTDMAACLLIFSSCWALWRYLETWRRAWLVSAAALTGAAMAAKLSCVVLVPVFALALVWNARRTYSGVVGRSAIWPVARRAGKRGLTAFCVAGLVIWAVYGFEVGPCFSDVREHPTLDRWLPGGRIRAAAMYVLEHVPVPAPSYARCWGRMHSHQRKGQWAFLHGQYSQTGWWYYYLVAAAIKTPLALFGLLALAAVAWRSARLRVSEVWIAVIVPPTLILFLSTLSNQNIGLRHILPAIPFLHLLAGGSWSIWRHSWGKVVLVALLAWYGGSMVRIHPHHLAYFNELIGGPKNGYHWLVDSNLDWGQDLKRLARYLDGQHRGRISLAYFGNARPEYYGIEYTAMPVALGLLQTPADAAIPRPTSGFVAISATELQDVYAEDKQRYAWLRRLSPIDNVGYSILIYDLGRARAQHP